LLDGVVVVVVAARAIDNDGLILLPQRGMRGMCQLMEIWSHTG